MLIYGVFKHLTHNHIKSAYEKQLTSEMMYASTCIGKLLNGDYVNIIETGQQEDIFYFNWFRILSILKDDIMNINETEELT